MSYYHFNRKEILQKEKGRYFKAEYYLQNKKATFKNEFCFCSL